MRTSGGLWQRARKVTADQEGKPQEGAEGLPKKGRRGRERIEDPTQKSKLGGKETVFIQYYSNPQINRITKPYCVLK